MPFIRFGYDIQTPHSHTRVIQSTHKYACACICCQSRFSAAFFSRTAKSPVPRKKSAGAFLKKCVELGFYALSLDIKTTHSTCNERSDLMSKFSIFYGFLSPFKEKCHIRFLCSACTRKNSFSIN